MDIHQQIQAECKEAEKRRLSLYSQLWYMIDLAEKNEGEYDPQPLKEAMSRLELVINDLDLFRGSSELD